MAMRWFQRLLPREDKFFDLFESHSQLLVAGADALQRLFQGGDQVALYCRIIIDKEDEADQLVREVMRRFAGRSSPHSTAATSRSLSSPWTMRSTR